MKTLPNVRTSLRDHLDRHMATKVTTDDPSPIAVNLDAPSGSTLWTQWGDARDWAMQWRHDASQLPDGATLEWVVRHLQNRPTAQPGQPGPLTSRQELPNRIIVAGLDAAAALAGDPYPMKLDITRRRWRALTDTFPDTADLRSLKELTTWPEADFTLLLSTAVWFTTHPVPDNAWTPRQVPVPGLHAKWLDPASRRTLIQRLASLPTLNLLTRPSQSRLTYLDPHHASINGRRWDIITTGDQVVLPYPPKVVIIIENRDTAFYFPTVIPHGIAAHGDGTAALGLITSIQPLVSAGAQLFYWGDIDAAGLRIVAGLRSRKHTVTTICMDVATYNTYARFGTSKDERGRPIPAGDPTPPDHLDGAETALYRLLTDPAWPGPRRIEQERIPLDDAARRLQQMTRAKPPIDGQLDPLT